MNKVVLVGRLTKDPEIKNTSSQVQFCNFTVAVDRRFKDQSGQRQADFINCVAWRQTASFISSYFRKGSKIGIVGSLQSRSFDDNNGQRRYVTEVVVDEAEFVESSGASKQGQASAPAQAPAPAAGSAAASAPTAPSTSIAPDLDSDAFEADGGLDLPFEF
ncbi:single-strand binding protein [Ruminococcaceae bacterium KH2T8]|nr:single-strand binding protein [Ruminococcaceae bacterium KH2T8]